MATLNDTALAIGRELKQALQGRQHWSDEEVHRRAKLSRTIKTMKRHHVFFDKYTTIEASDKHTTETSHDAIESPEPTEAIESHLSSLPPTEIESHLSRPTTTAIDESHLSGSSTKAMSLSSGSQNAIESHLSSGSWQNGD
jgi:hypothetical protein